MAVATLTPFHDDGSLALELVPGYVEHLLERGASALMVAGTTGEFVTLSGAERGEVIRTFIDAAAGRTQVIAHVGHADPGEAARLAAEAVAAGADAIAAILPYFHPTEPASVRETLCDLAATQPRTPFLAYCHPATGNSLGAAELAAMLGAVPQVVGAKLSLATFAEIEPYLALPDRPTLFCGNDSLLHEFVGGGGRALVSGNAAVFCEVVSRGLAALLAHDQAKLDRLDPLIEEIVRITRSGAPDRLKALLRARGVDAGVARVRTAPDATAPPPLSPALSAALIA